ncbi:MAG: tRNA uridine-5-carboxymethylaminomethyl(34) synthesis enzyme MnmG [Clostridiales bacterium]|jgi:tRNA uridine 5-carboxymethylaminomethyl modification enzyme|nr:tRNA uridine-5-carboxymethylaminomethyl(34) synthesis enzyme MnmG [Clostridiales bacterium]
MQKTFDIIVVGGGHAGAEAALAAARLGRSVLLITMSLDSIAFLACNPNIGGTSKAQLVREIDALGGEMGVAADKAVLQMKMLNGAKGAAVRSLRGQVDKSLYHRIMKRTLEDTPNLVIRQDEATELLTENGEVKGIRTEMGYNYFSGAVVLATGVYLNSRIVIGEYTKRSGPSGFFAAVGMSDSLRENGIEIRRFKTGTPPRVHKRSIDFSKTEVQEGEKGICSFSFLNDFYDADPAAQARCYLTYTTPETREIILKNIHRSPMYNGAIEGVGPRYCPSIEDKIMRFRDKERHQIFIEPEGADTSEMYIQGASSSLPTDVQTEVIRSMVGLKNAEIMRFAYAIEYDCLNPEQLTPSLGIKHIKGLYTAGQINGTSGYEEAACQGLVAGINAVNYLKGNAPLVLKRNEAYIGVLIDDLVTKGTNEPYRMMTSRAEYRLVLRQDNADTRLTEYGRAVGLVTDERYEKYLKKQAEVKEIAERLETAIPPNAALKKMFEEKGMTVAVRGYRLSELLRRPEFGFGEIETLFDFSEYSRAAKSEVEAEIKYGGYIDKQNSEITTFLKADRYGLPDDLDYTAMSGLRLEARAKLNKIKPVSVGQAMRISGVSPADIGVLMIYLSKKG